MYTILVTESNELVTTQREAVMCRSKLVDTLQFLVDPIYKGIDMSVFTVLLEYISPASRKYRTEYLTLSDELYKNKLQYLLPFDTKLTQEQGEVEIQLTFVNVVLQPDGSNKQYVRKTQPTTITIIPQSAWSDIMPDEALSAFDQRLIKQQAMMNQLLDMTNAVYENKADNIEYDGKVFKLKAGDKVLDTENIQECTNPDGDHSGSGSYSEEGVPVVEFGSYSSGSGKDDSDSSDGDIVDSPTSNDDYEVVEF